MAAKQVTVNNHFLLLSYLQQPVLNLFTSSSSSQNNIVFILNKMSHIYDNWERLVDAVLKKQHFWDLCHAHSRTPSLLSEASDLSSSFRSTSYPDDDDVVLDFSSSSNSSPRQDELEMLQKSPPTTKYFKANIKKSKVSILAFEVADVMSKLIHLWQSLSDESIVRLRSDVVGLEGVRKLISSDDDDILLFICAEFVENLRLIAEIVSRISKKCENSTLRSFDKEFYEFATRDRDQNSWILSSKEMKSKMKQLDQFVTFTATLRREIDEHFVFKNALKKLLPSGDVKKSVKYLKEKSVWSRSFDTVTLLLARSIFTTFARIKLVFGINHSIYASTLVHPFKMFSMLQRNPPDIQSQNNGFFELNPKILKKPVFSTLGSVGLALHYANIIIVMEKMISAPRLVGADARSDLYAMLPYGIRLALSKRLRGMRFLDTDPVLANEWRIALQNILGWILPMAQNMIKWQNERNFEQQKIVPRTNVLLLQTLYFADQEKTEGTIIELLMGLNYIWWFQGPLRASTRIIKALSSST